MKFKTLCICISLLLVSLLFFSCTGFNRLEHIVGPYYLVEVDSKEDLSISYKTNDRDYVGKIPNIIIEYGYNDSFLIAKTKDYSDRIHYYVIDRTKDFDIAQEENFRFGPITENEFANKWKERLKVSMKSAN